jgi:hypothetical protein
MNTMKGKVSQKWDLLKVSRDDLYSWGAYLHRTKIASDAAGGPLGPNSRPGARLAAFEACFEDLNPEQVLDEIDHAFTTGEGLLAMSIEKRLKLKGEVDAVKKLIPQIQP